MSETIDYESIKRQARGIVTTQYKDGKPASAAMYCDCGGEWKHDRALIQGHMLKCDKCGDLGRCDERWPKTSL